MKNKYCGKENTFFQNCSESDEDHPSHQKEEGTEYFLEKTEKAGVRISDSGINKQKIQIKKTKNISGMKKNSTTVSKLKSRKKYYIRIRTWKKKNRKKYYSAWSKVKIGKTK